ncbi:endonuclease/exonuclease/phosphatase family protein [Haloferula sp.]|uniref:endonuclease/exonuclease/phosphatase family protein n=1 Tax=Haloferula sp. TaxID=2497595 RepID=UPI003C710E34
MWRLVAILLGLTAPLGAVGLRVVTFNIETHRNSSGWPDYALDNPSSMDFTSVARILERIDADVVALQEVHTSDWNEGDVAALGNQLGLPHRFIGSNSGNFDSSLRVVFLSRYPFSFTDSIMSPPGAKEIARHCPVVVVDVPGTSRDPLLISAHIKAGTGTADRFRKAIEMQRLVKYFNETGVEASDNFILLGDFNPSGANRTYTSAPSGLPNTFVLGSDITFPVTFSGNMLSYFSGLVPTLLDPRQLNGSAATFEFGQTLDLFLVSPALAGRPYGAEIYRSSLDDSNSTGLPKSGAPLNDNSSSIASDHYAVFADFELDQDFSDLSLAVSSASIVEGSPASSVQLTATLPGTAASPVEITFSSDNPGVAFPVDAVVTIPVGGSSASTTISTSRNYLVDGTRSVIFEASSSGYDSAMTGFNVLDADGPYVFTAAGETISETFDGFAGNQDPAPWTSNTSGWQGSDDGSSGVGGARSYGVGGDDSLGYLADGGELVANVNFINQSEDPLGILEIGYQAEQWRSAMNGSADRITVDLVVEGVVTPLGPLSFDARMDLPSGPASYVESKLVRVDQLAIAPGEDFSLRFTISPGAGSGVLPADVFINEFHYDNFSDDVGEFVEIVVGPGFTGELSGVELVFYNGNNGAEGARHGLDSFTLGTTTSSGHRVYSKLISGIQNGSPDGFALVVEGVATSFLSYEGSFMAVDGPASGMTSMDVGVSQGTNDQAGTNAIGLVGTGGSSLDFTWQKISGSHSPGAVNAGQTLMLPGLPPQGLAIDDLMVTFVSDYDGDGLADDEDGDDDNDGQTDDFELAFGSDPLDRASVFRTSFDGGMLSFPGSEGILYTVEWCDDLVGWETLSSHLGEGADITVELPAGETRAFFRVRAGE